MEQNARFCPNCGSTWVEPDTSNRAEVAFSGGNPNKWQCNECGYTGIMPTGNPEEEFEPEDSGQENLDFQPGEEYPREDTEFGTGYLKYVVYVTLPVLSIYILYKLLI